MFEQVTINEKGLAVSQYVQQLCYLPFRFYRGTVPYTLPTRSFYYYLFYRFTLPSFNLPVVLYFIESSRMLFYGSRFPCKSK